MTSKEIKELLKPWLEDVLRDAKKKMTIVEVAREIWRIHENELRKDEALFLTWQYEMRLAAQSLVDEAKIEKSRDGWVWL